MKRIFTTCLSALIMATATSQTEVRDYRPGVTKEGITYFLPTTKLQIVITAKRTTHTPGTFANYAERYLRVSDVTFTEQEVWEILSVEMSTLGAADPSQAYTIAHNIKSTVPFVRLAPDGRLLSINCEAEEVPEMQEGSVQKVFTKHLDPDKFKTQEILSAGSVPKMAELTAAEIYDIRENRSLLAKGLADFMPKDGEQLRLMLQSLEDQENALLQLFKGTTESEIHTFVLDYTPPTTDVEGEVLFRFSKLLGLVEADDLAGEPYYIDIKDLKTLPAPVEEAPVPDKKKGFKLPIKKEPTEVLDLRYRLPGTARIRIYDMSNTLAQIETPLAQFGRIEHLGGDLFNKKLQTSIQLSPTTGALMKIDMLEPTK